MEADENGMILETKLLKHFKELGVTVEQAAESSGIKASKLKKMFEQHRCNDMFLSELKKIAGYLKVDLDYLMETNAIEYTYKIAGKESFKIGPGYGKEKADKMFWDYATESGLIVVEEKSVEW